MAEKKIILFLDDQEKWRQTIRNGLREFDVRPVGSIQEFHQILRSGEVKPDLFLIDWLLSPSDELTAEKLIKELLTDYPDIPRIVLTAGRGDEGTAPLIAELKCDYVGKGDLAATRAAIERSLQKVINSGTPEQDEVYYLETALRQEEKQRKKEERRKKELAKEKKMVLEEKKIVLEQKKELERDQRFFERFINISKSIVDETLDLQQFAIRLLQLLMEYSECPTGIIISFKEKAGVLVDSEIEPVENKHDPPAQERIKSYIAKRISINDIGSYKQIRNLTQGAINDLPEGGERYTKCKILENFKSNDKAAQTFTNIRLSEIARRNHLLLMPITMNGDVSGVILLFDKLGDRNFEYKDKEKIDQLPLSDILNGAAEMPFRTYDEKGLLKGFLKKVLRKPWAVKQFIVSTYMELLRISVAIISILIISIPTALVGRHLIYRFLGYEGHTLHMDVLGSIETLLMLLTFILFSLGLIVLFEPSYARGLPRWMLNFTRISTLEGTILRLVVIILSIHILGRFLDSIYLQDNSTARYSPLELLTVSFSICFLVVVIGVFTKYFLQEKEEKRDDE